MRRRDVILYTFLVMWVSTFRSFGMEFDLFPRAPVAKNDLASGNLTALFNQPGSGLNMGATQHDTHDDLTDQSHQSVHDKCAIMHSLSEYNVTKADGFLRCLCEIEDAGTHACRIEIDHLLDGLPFAFASFAKLAINTDQNVLFSIWTSKAYYCKAQVDQEVMSFMCYRDLEHPGAGQCKSHTYLCELANCLRASVHTNHLMKAIFLACVKESTIRMSHLLNDPFRHVIKTTPPTTRYNKDNGIRTSQILLIEALVGGVVGGVIIMTILICLVKMCRARVLERRNTVERRPKSVSPTPKSHQTCDSYNKRESNVYDVLDETSISSRQNIARTASNDVPDVLGTVHSKNHGNNRTDYSILRETGGNSADSEDYNRLRNLTPVIAHPGVYRNALTDSAVPPGRPPTDDYDHIPSEMATFSPAPLTPPRKFSKSIIDLDGEVVEYTKVDKVPKKSPKPKPRLQIKEVADTGSDSSSVNGNPNYFILEPHANEAATTESS
ncbi:uncharacterized protein LOC121366976 [Gigantopelta aegis]|uniref:uncharacterized protein LOC121366976 n=1 Tax=Gigantopelta aegis TaxID=1735272 RepID=UPI001B88ABB1|nr:uncharacterized protein LOC121366976 [Gigantopelta aegis]